MPRLRALLVAASSVALIRCGARSDLEVSETDAACTAHGYCSVGDPPVSIAVSEWGDLGEFGDSLYIGGRYVPAPNLLLQPKDFGPARSLISVAEWAIADTANPGSHDGADQPLADASGVYFLSFPYAFAVAPQGGVPRKLSWNGKTDDVAQRIAIDADYVYNLEAGGLARVPKGGGVAERFPLGIDVPNETTYGLGVDDVNVYWFDTRGNGFGTKVWAAPKGGGARKLLAWGQDPQLDALDDLFLDGDNLYLVQRGDTLTPGQPRPGAIYVLSKSGGVPRHLADTAPMSAVTVHQGRAYWADSGSVWQLVGDGDAAVVENVASGGLIPSLAADDACIYWITMTGGGSDLSAVLTRAPR